MMSLTTHTLLNGQKNCAVKVTGVGVGDLEWTTVVQARDLNTSRVKIDHLEWAITSQIEVFLAWHVKDALDGGELIVPLAGRGTLNFSDYGGLTNGLDGRSGDIEVRVQKLVDTPRGVQAFVLFLDLIKQE